MNHHVNDVVLYKTLNKNGEVIRYGNKAPEVRKISRFLTNERNETVFEWQSDKGQGVCIISLWEEWQNGMNENKKRGRENQ